MLGEGFFKSQLETVRIILDSVGLLEESQSFPDKSQGASSFRGMTYGKLYEKLIRDFIFDFRLVDQSLLLFVKGGTNEHDGLLGYSFYDSPSSVMSYRDFVIAECIDEQESIDIDGDVESWGDHLMPDYEKYIESSSLKTVVTPLRYDYRAKDYRMGVHPASHFHFGFESDIRVAGRRVLTPVGFILFIIRQRYPSRWEKLRCHPRFHIWKKNVRADLKLVHSNYWTGGDEDELFLQ